MKKILIAALLLMILAACSGGNEATGNTALETGIGATEAEATLDLYVMSQCPYGVQAENQISPILKELGKDLEFNLYFIGGGEPGNLQSLHGQPEIDGNKIQLCAVKLYPDTYFDFVDCMNKNPTKIPDNWKDCADELELNKEELQTCFDEEAEELLAASFKKSSQAGARGSPTIIINGETYSGKRDTMSLMRAICSEYDEKPEACLDIPEPVKFDVTILTSENCDTCNTARPEAALKEIFEGISFRHVNIDTEEGKELVERYGAVKVPTFVFDSKVNETEVWKSEPTLSEAFKEIDSVYVLDDRATGAVQYIDPEKEALRLAAIEEAKKQALEKLGVKEKPQIDFFVMSYCPYGDIAEEAIEPVFTELGELANFKPHYVFSKSAQATEDKCRGEYCSLHGRVELNQNLREMCVFEQYGAREWFDFAMEMNDKCNYENADECWEDVAADLGLDTDAIATCEEEEGERILQEEYELNALLGVTGSPTVFVQGMPYSGPRSAEGYKYALCQEFEEKPEACVGLREPAAVQQQAAPAGNC